MAAADRYKYVPKNAAASPALLPEGFKSRWEPDDQKGNGNLMTPAKTLEALKLVKTGGAGGKDGTRPGRPAGPPRRQSCRRR